MSADDYEGWDTIDEWLADPKVPQYLKAHDPFEALADLTDDFRKYGKDVSETWFRQLLKRFGERTLNFVWEAHQMEQASKAAVADVLLDNLRKSRR